MQDDILVPKPLALGKGGPARAPTHKAADTTIDAGADSPGTDSPNNAGQRRKAQALLVAAVGSQSEEKKGTNP